MIKAILFDFDGTLVDTSKAIFMGYRHLFETFRPDYNVTPKEYDSFLGPALKDVFPKYFKEDMDTLLKEYRLASDKYINADHIKLFDGVEGTLRTLKNRGIKLAIVTSRQSHSAKKVLEPFNILELFDVVLGCDSVVQVKPAAEPYLKALDELKVSVDEAIMVGDHPADVMGSSLLNIYSIGVNWSPHAKELVESGTNQMISKIEELIMIIEEMK